jgi:hypothetical protein
MTIHPVSAMRLPARLLLVLLLGFGLSGPAAAQFQRSAEDLFVGTPVTVTLPAGADTLLVTYRPNSAIATTDAIPATGGQVAWTPADAGVVALAVPGGARETVSVRFQDTPAAGMLVLVLAGTILFGGAIFAFRKLFERRPDGHPG